MLNVATQAVDPQSMLSLYRALIRLRRNSDVLLFGAYRLLSASEHVLVYERRLGDERVVVALNMSGRTRAVSVESSGYERLISTYLDDFRPSTDKQLLLRGDEGLILREAFGKV